ncbi:MAG: RHS repeat-associated core domain-containing protein [Candidatus Thiothrix singaporensis]|uniref:RHS repeat-associated core domain-containing protein n=1 Tax=Candidatus Thiothrix singaporensis TaxID=2799669 RepID=A0A7L6AWS1_9GAMM|nr:MAG: RHS repeat-associated core domain-containing protein [Candidatus Thiothrix singaporensis]
MATDSNRRIVWKWESDAFGTTVPQQDPNGDGKQTIVNLRFPGQYYDAESGLHQNWHRTYDPSLGRYISSDPIGLAGGVNTYGYVANEPINWADPSGLEKLILFPQKTPEYLAAQSVPDTPGLLTVYAHGNENVVSSTPEATNKMDAQALKDRIINDVNYTDGMPIQLMSCNAGSGDHPIAEQLANLMDTPTSVSGYDGYVVYLPKTPLNSAIVSPFPWASNNSYKK